MCLTLESILIQKSQNWIKWTSVVFAQQDSIPIFICLNLLFRETGSMEQHAEAMVALLESCLSHNLKPCTKDEDPPHAKISSDLISCIFLVSIFSYFAPTVSSWKSSIKKKQCNTNCRYFKILLRWRSFKVYIYQLHFAPDYMSSVYIKKFWEIVKVSSHSQYLGEKKMNREAKVCP